MQSTQTTITITTTTCINYTHPALLSVNQTPKTSSRPPLPPPPPPAITTAAAAAVILSPGPKHPQPSLSPTQAPSLHVSPLRPLLAVLIRLHLRPPPARGLTRRRRRKTLSLSLLHRHPWLLVIPLPLRWTSIISYPLPPQPCSNSLN